MVVLGGRAVSYERGTPVEPVQFLHVHSVLGGLVQVDQRGHHLQGCFVYKTMPRTGSDHPFLFLH